MSFVSTAFDFFFEWDDNIRNIRRKVEEEVKRSV